VGGELGADLIGAKVRVALTNEQQAALFLAARPLEPQDRQAFRDTVAAALHGISDPGDGDVHRAIRLAQRKFFCPPGEHAQAPRMRSRL